MGVPGTKVRPDARSPWRGFAPSLPPVNKLCIFGGTIVGSYACWALGDALGFSFFGSFLLSGVGSIAGVYLGWKLAQKIER
jgi:hypothetical protein